MKTLTIKKATTVAALALTPVLGMASSVQAAPYRAPIAQRNDSFKNNSRYEAPRVQNNRFDQRFDNHRNDNRNNVRFDGRRNDNRFDPKRDKNNSNNTAKIIGAGIVGAILGAVLSR